MTDMWNAV